MLRRARVPKSPPPPQPAAASTPQRGPLPKRKEAAAAAAAGALAVLSRTAVDVVLYSFMAALWADSAVGTVVRILGRWVFGEGSSVEAAGFAVSAWCTFIMVLLFPSYLPLVIRRVSENAMFHLKEQEKDEREKVRTAVLVLTFPKVLLRCSEHRTNLIGESLFDRDFALVFGLIYTHV